MRRQHHNQCQQRRHHHLGDALQTVLQAQTHYAEAQQHRHRHPRGHLGSVRQQRAEHAADFLGTQTVKGAHRKLEKIAEHPAGHRGVVHHQQVAARHAEQAVDVPLAALRFQRPVSDDSAALACPADGQLHDEHRRAHDDQKQQVEQHKHAAAVLSRHEGEAPDVADADGAARAHQQEAQPGPKALSFHSLSISSPTPPPGGLRGGFCPAAERFPF